MKIVLRAIITIAVLVILVGIIIIIITLVNPLLVFGIVIAVCIFALARAVTELIFTVAGDK